MNPNEGDGGGVFTGSWGEQTGDGEADEWRWAGGGVMCRAEMVGCRRGLDVLECKKKKQNEVKQRIHHETRAGTKKKNTMRLVYHTGKTNSLARHDGKSHVFMLQVDELMDSRCAGWEG